MDQNVFYKAFEINKSYSDLIHDSSIWISDLNFIRNELLFLKTILKSNSFKLTTPILFERLQLLQKNSDRLNESNNAIQEKIEKFRTKVAKTLKSDVFSISEGYFETYQSLEKEIFEFNKKHKSFKTYLYEFLIEFKCIFNLEK